MPRAAIPGCAHQAARIVDSSSSEHNNDPNTPTGTAWQGFPIGSRPTFDGRPSQHASLHCFLTDPTVTFMGSQMNFWLGCLTCLVSFVSATKQRQSCMTPRNIVPNALAHICLCRVFLFSPANR